MKSVETVTCSYKVAVERMGIEIIADRFGSSYKGLTDYLTPKQTLSAGHPVVCPSGEKQRNNLNTCNAVSLDNAYIALTVNIIIFIDHFSKIHIKF